MATQTAAVAARLEKTSASNQLKAYLAKYFYLCMGLVMSGVVIAGFSRTVDQALFHATPPRPLLLWFHGAAFSLWMVFFIAQSTLVRVRQMSVHRLLGWFGAALAATMVVLGVSVALVMTRFDITVLHQVGTDAFLSIPFLDMAVFGTLVTLAIVWRKKPDYHRRLVFISTCLLMDAGIGRFEFWFNNSIFFVFVDFLIVLGAVRDRVVEGKVHQIYRYALPPLAVLQSLAIYLWRIDPAWWKRTTQSILGL
jgi:hypothetical protein